MLEGNAKLGLSYENSKRLIERKLMINDKLQSYIDEGFRESRLHLNKEVNKKLYELAEKNNVSLWDLCFSVVPKIEASYPTFDTKDLLAQRCGIEYTVTLEPMSLEFEKGPGYWKGKYFKLKEQLQKLIDSKDDRIEEDVL